MGPEARKGGGSRPRVDTRVGPPELGVGVTLELWETDSGPTSGPAFGHFLPSSDPHPSLPPLTRLRSSRALPPPEEVPPLEPSNGARGGMGG